MKEYLLISDAAKEVKVESHVLRYWEDELRLPIKRNEMGHRYYTVEDVERFKQIKSMKERGLQLKAIKMILKDGKLDVLPPEDEEISDDNMPQIPIDIVASRPLEPEKTGGAEIVADNQDGKSKRLQWLLQQLIRETLEENNKELCMEIKNSVIKELDYQFRVQEEREEERARAQFERSEEYYKKMDELLRTKSAKKKIRQSLKEAEKLNKQDAAKKKAESKTIDMQSHKKTRHFIF